MKEFYNATRRQTLLLALVYLIMGIAFVAKPDVTFHVIVYILAVTLLVLGVFKIAAYVIAKPNGFAGNNGLSTGLIASILGVFMLIKPDVLESIIGTLLGFAVIIGGIIALQTAIDLRTFRHPQWGAILVISLIVTILGIVSVAVPFSATKTLIMLIGVSMLFVAAGYMVAYIFIVISKKNIDDFAKTAENAETVEVVATEEATEE
ncbi:MAG: DUF308 domain-containing protein [Lachnospiraceae bacterium]|nr:DUF308 domain-containing protein [Lachnospiraceae bacterium]